MKNTEKRKHLKYDRRKDPYTNNYLDTDGSYVIFRDVKRGNRWEKEIVARITPNDYPNGKEIIHALCDMDYYEDCQEEDIHNHLDKVFQKKLAKFEQDGENTQFTDPWEEVPYAIFNEDIVEQAFPEERPINYLVTKAEAFIETLEPQQKDLFFEFFGMQKTLADIRREELAAGKDVTQQGISHRKDRIISKACKYFGITKPQKRKNSSD